MPPRASSSGRTPRRAVPATSIASRWSVPPPR